MSARDDGTFRLRLRAVDAAAAEIASAEAFEVGALGVVEDEPGTASGGVVLTIYLPGACREALRAALGPAVARGALVVEAESAVEDEVWAETWKEVLVPVEISPRLGVTPPFATPERRPGQCWITIEPGQAFGTGAHHSTHLALQALDAVLARRAGAVSEVLDVGTGSGVLALAALALGAGRALGFDLDPLAAPAARQAAVANGLADRAEWLTGPIDTVRERPFDLVVANLLRRELLPIAPAVAARVAPDGDLVLAGLLERDAPHIEGAFGPFGLRERQRWARRDDDGEAWIGLVLARDAG